MLSSVTAMPRLSLTLRALLLVPLLAVGVDLARATLACGPRAESCLEAAGRGWLGPAGVVLILLYAAALSVGIARLARGMAARPGAPPSVARLWAVGSAGVAAVCGGQALIAGALDGPAALGGGWLALVALCLLAGGVVALVLRAAPAAAAALRALRPAAPRPPAAAPLLLLVPAAPRRRPRAPHAQAAAGRAPPLTTG